MFQFAPFFGQAAGIVAFVAFIPYILSILRKETKPNRATFAIWSMVNVVILLSYLASGARDTIWVAFVYTICQLIVLLLSLKYGVGGFTKLDIICLASAALGICLWILTKQPTTALYISIFVEILGFIPTIKKSYLYPKTESSFAWVIFFLASSLNLFAITSFKFEIIVYPIYNFIFDGTVMFLLVFPQIRFFKRK